MQQHHHFWRRILRIIPLAALVAGAFGCQPSIPSGPHEAGRSAAIAPDFTALVIPPNIAPLNFEITEPGERFVTDISGSGTLRRVFAGRTVQIPISFWRRLLEENRSKTVYFTVYAYQNGKWIRYEPIQNQVASEPIDPVLTYRLIEPGYDRYGHIIMEERSLENFKTRAFFDNEGIGRKTCANCHHARRGNPEEALFHVRQEHGGTLLRWKGEWRKIGTKSERSGYSMSYPAWHPTLPLLAYSSNSAHQVFHSFDLSKIEVIDLFSDLMLYDIEQNALLPIFETEDVYETFPAWSGDGKELYFCRATLKTSEERTGTRREAAERRNTEMSDRYREIRYSLLKMPFDVQRREFGAPETLLDAEKNNASYVHPRFSPDGRFLVYVKLDYGTFPLTHSKSELWLYDTERGTYRPLSEINSDAAESFHAWDSSGRWLVFSTRRGDGAFTKVYFTHFDQEGNCTKPFLLPRKDPTAENREEFSYNLPEFLIGPVPASNISIKNIIFSAVPDNAATESAVPVMSQD